MDEKYHTDYPNSNYLENMNNLNKTNQHVDLNRLPTLGEILSNKTKAPVDLFTFYRFMKDVENRVEYLDFWFDLVNHLNLCKHYVRGLRNSIMKNQNRNSNALENHKSLSSSVLLELIINDDILQDNDSNRLSQFLRGDLNVNDPKLSELINQYELETIDYKHQLQATDPSSFQSPQMYASNFNSPKYSGEFYNQQPNDQYRPPSGFSSINDGGVNGNKRISSTSRLIDNDNDNNINNMGTPNRNSSINPSLLEKLVRNSPHLSANSFITRNNLKESTQNLLLKYFVEDSEKNLNLPNRINNYVIRSNEVDGRDDPDIFNHVKSYVFNKIENEHLPNFLNFIAIKNLNSNFIRIIVGLFFIFAAFWIGFVLIFLDYSKALRVVVLAPFLIGFYCLISAIYLIDPILVWIKRTQSFSSSKRFIKIREPFIFKLLFKRSLWVCFLILLLTAIFTVIFSLVPGHRL